MTEIDLATLPPDKSFCEFFAGIGLVREGLSRSGWTCAFANDIDEKKRRLYVARFGDEGHFHLGDVWNTDEVLARMPDRPFLATASFPCVDLSLAGLGKGFAGERSSTFFGFLRVVESLGDRRPGVVMLENVNGFITSRNGEDFARAARELAALGYRLDAFVLDARFFVPQSRPRVFVIGLHESIAPPLAARRSKLDWIKDDWQEVVEAAPSAIRPARLVELMRSIELPTGWTAFDLKLPPPRDSGLSDLIDLDDAQEWWDAPAVAKHLDMMHDRHRIELERRMSTGEHFVGTIFRRKRDGRTRAEVRFDDVAGCLRTPKGGSARQIVVALDDGRLRMRWMSAREYARLQGAPDFPLGPNVGANLHAFGDAVCVPVIRWIDDSILTPVFDWTRRIGER